MISGITREENGSLICVVLCSKTVDLCSILFMHAVQICYMYNHAAQPHQVT